MTPFLKGADHTEKLSVIDFIIPFSWGEGSGYESTRVSVSIDVELCQDCSQCPFRCVAFDLEGFCLIGHDKNWFFGESFLHFIERCLCVVIPYKGLVFLEELVKWLCQVGESFDESSIKVSKSKPRSDLFDSFWDWPVSDSFQFTGVHHHFAFFNDKSKVFDSSFAELAFAGFEVEVIFSKSLEYFLGHFFQFFFGFRKDQDVVHINNDPSFIEFIFEDVVHHSLKCGRRIA